MRLWHSLCILVVHGSSYPKLRDLIFGCDYLHNIRLEFARVLSPKLGESGLPRNITSF